VVLPGCETIAVVIGLGWLLSQVTVCPVLGFTVGEQAARAGTAALDSAAVASAKAEAVERRSARTRIGTPTVCRGRNRFDQRADRIFDPPISGCATR
jgi:hypothetical protein